MRRITVFDNNDFELLAKENGFKIDAQKEWKKFLKERKIDCDYFLDYSQLNDLILKFIEFEEDPNNEFYCAIDEAYLTILTFEKKHSERYDNISDLEKDYHKQN